MLILTRKPGQAVILNESIRVVILDRWKLGIEAPPGVPIRREELAPLPRTP